METFDRDIICTDHDGNQHTLRVFRITRLGEDALHPADPLYRIWTNEGGRVERFGKGKYQVAQSRLTLKTNDPGAP